MEQNTLYIKWATGYMNINLDAFFPCTMAKFNKLLKIIELPYDWNYQDELLEKLKVYFQNRIQRLPDEAEQERKKAATYREAAADLKKQIKAEKQERKKKGLAPDPWELENRYESYIALAQEAERKAKALSNAKPKFEGYLAKLT